MQPISAQEGWFVSHLFWNIDRADWAELDEESRRETAGRFENTVTEWRRRENHQLHCYSIWGLKADFGVIAICPGLHRLNRLENELAESFPAGVLTPAASFVSLTETSEYISQHEDYASTLSRQGLDPESEEFKSKLDAFRGRMSKYSNDRLYPDLPDHKVMCFYPMNKRRGEQDNWYLLDFETRKRYMASHGITGRQYSDQVKQLVTGSAGLDDWEWGVTLFADDPYYFKKIVYEMRYDEASARFAEFGPFLVGLHLEPNELLETLMIRRRGAPGGTK